MATRAGARSPKKRVAGQKKAGAKKAAAKSTRAKKAKRATKRRPPAGPPRATARTRSGRKRLAVVYDIDGPRVRLGFGWFVLVATALAVGAVALAVVYGVCAMAAAAQGCRCWQSKKIKPNVAVAAGFAGLVPLLAVIGPAAAGLAILALPVGALLVVGLGRRPFSEALGEAAYTMQVSLPPGLAAASVVLLRDFRLGTAVALVLMASAYETGDFLIGTGSRNSFEGPIVGVVALFVTTFTVAALQVAPFDFGSAFLFGAIAAVLIPAGQLLASAVLPWAGSRAPALRRIDSLLLAAPVWYLLADPLLT